MNDEKNKKSNGGISSSNNSSSDGSSEQPTIATIGGDLSSSSALKIMNLDEFIKSNENWKKEMKAEMVESARVAGDRSSIHGIPTLSSEKAHISIKLFWILCCLASWGFFIYEIVVLVTAFTQYDVVSTVSVAYEAPSNFPAIDICNLNPYNGFTQRVNIELILLAKNIQVENFTTLIDYTDAASDQFKSVFEYLDSTDKIDIYKFGFYLENMLISCEYQGKMCTSSDFYYYHDYNYGNCYRFNGADPNQTLFNHNYTSYPIKRSTKPGWRNGLRLELYTGDQSNQQQYMYKTGIRLIVHNQSIVPLPDEDGIDVATGTQTNVAISRTFNNRLANPYSDCLQTLTEAASNKNAVLKTMYNFQSQKIINKYQQNICMKICEQNFIFGECGCYDLTYSSLGIVNGTLGCLTGDQVICLENADIEFYNGQESENCYDQCPLECYTISYATSISTADYPSQWYADLLIKYADFFGYSRIYNSSGAISGDINNGSSSLTQAIIKATTAMVNINYDTLTYTVIEQSPALDFDTLLSNIGGNLGLFTGASVLSFVEIIEILGTLGLIYFSHKRLQRKKTPTEIKI